MCQQGRLVFYSDLVAGGKRFATTCCNKSGDILQLIQDVKRLPRATADSFFQKYWPEGYTEYADSRRALKTYEQNAKAIETVWNDSLTLTNAVNSDNFSHFLRTLQSDFDHLQMWHDQNIDLQFRYITKAGITASLRESGINVRGLLPTDKAANSFLITRGFFVPGHLASLTLFYMSPSDKQLNKVQLLADPESQNPGYLIHPKAAMSHEGVVYIPDHRWFLRASLWQANSSRSVSPLCTSFNEVGAKTLSAQMLQPREVTFWQPKLTARTLKAAERLSATVSHYGADGNRIHGKVFKQLNPNSLFKSLTQNSRSWQSSIEHSARHTPRQELVQLILEAELSPSAISELGNSLEEVVCTALQERELDRIPANVVSGTFGVVEQTPKGWYVTHRGQTEQVCSIPWKIVGSDADSYEVDFYTGSGWVSAIVEKKSLIRRTAETLADACLELDLPPFTVAPKWRTSILHIGMQLNPMDPVELSREPLGIDLKNYCVRFSSCEVSTATGEITRKPSKLPRKLLPEGDGEMPAAKAVQAILNHKPTCSIISAMVLQLMRQAFGGQEIAIGFGGQYVLQTTQLFEEMGVTSNEPDSLFKIASDGQQLTPKQVKSKMSGDDPIWAAAPLRAINWLAGTRPTVHLGDHCRPGVPANSVNLQRSLIQVLSKSVNLLNQNRPIFRAIQEAWIELAEKVGCRAIPEPTVPKLVRPIDAFAYWVNIAIRSNQFALRTGRPKKPNTETIYQHYKDVIVSRQLVSGMIKDAGFPAWEMTRLISSFVSCEEFVEHKRIGGVEMTSFKNSLLDKDTRQVLSAAMPIRATSAAAKRRSATA